jgi:agmatinase
VTGLYSRNFLALERELSGYENSKAAVLPVPYDATVSYGAGARYGPQAIISASSQVETYDHEFGYEPCRIGIATMEELERQSSGPEDMLARVEKVARDIIDDGKFLLTLGGEHSLSYPLVKAHREKYHDLAVLHIDAHSDLRDEYQGSKYSHACVMSRIRECCSFVSVGVRSFCGSENEMSVLGEGRIITSKELRNKIKSLSNILSMLSSNVYITFDLDALDPSVMPAVGTPEPGGLLWDEAVELIVEIGQNREIVGADVVELAPIPGLIYPDFTAARLAYKIIAIAFNGRE